MQGRWVMQIGLVVWLLPAALWAQQAPPDPQATALTQQLKSAYYTQVEYQRCRQDVLELLVKTDIAEKRAQDLQAEAQKLREELATLREKVGEKAPSN